MAMPIRHQESSPRPGRPRYVITSEQLLCLSSEFLNSLRRQNLNSWALGGDLRVSRQTIYDRRRELGFSFDFERFSVIQDTNLDAMVQEELDAFPRTALMSRFGAN